MAVQTLKKGQNLTVGATEDELVFTPPFQLNGKIKFTNVSGTSKFCIGGPTSDGTLTSYTTAGTVVEFSIDPLSQWDTVNRIHCSGVGVWTVQY